MEYAMEFDDNWLISYYQSSCVMDYMCVRTCNESVAISTSSSICSNRET